MTSKNKCLSGKFYLGQIDPYYKCFIMDHDMITARIDDDGHVQLSKEMVSKIKEELNQIDVDKDKDDCQPHSWKPWPKYE